jgi:hypothetical protein
MTPQDHPTRLNTPAPGEPQEVIVLASDSSQEQPDLLPASKGHTDRKSDPRPPPWLGCPSSVYTAILHFGPLTPSRVLDVLMMPRACHDKQHVLLAAEQESRPAPRRKPGDRSYLGAFSAADIAEGKFPAWPAGQPMAISAADKGKGKREWPCEGPDGSEPAGPSDGRFGAHGCAWAGVPDRDDGGFDLHSDLPAGFPEAGPSMGNSCRCDDTHSTSWLEHP